MRCAHGIDHPGGHEARLGVRIWVSGRQALRGHQREITPMKEASLSSTKLVASLQPIVAVKACFPDAGGGVNH